ncbi:MAG: hypothetical protein Q9218_007463 [Villophora microphyllina]
MSVAIQGGRPHSKPPFLTASPLGLPPVGIQVGVADVVEDVNEEVVDDELVEEDVEVEVVDVVVAEDVEVVDMDVGASESDGLEVDDVREVFGTIGVGGVFEVVEVMEVVVMVELIAGLQEHAELYRAGAVPHAADALLGKPVVAVWGEAVNVAQKAASEE